MTVNVFSVPIFFIILRETIEAGIVISILLTFVGQLTRDRIEALGGTTHTAEHTLTDEKDDPTAHIPQLTHDTALTNNQLLRKLRLQIWAGAISGFIIALAIGGAFIGVFYSNKLRDLWSQSELIWEGVFSLIASFIILAMGLAFLRLEQSKAKWRVKLAHAFEKKTTSTDGKGGRSGKYALFLLPFITVLREGLEAVVFAGGVSLGADGRSIPLAVVCGIIAGAFISYLIYKSSSRLTLHIFLIVSTGVLLLVGAGLFSSACGYFQIYVFNKGVGGDVSETGDGPGSFNVNGSVWHLTYGNPEGGSNRGGGWGIFQAILGWTNNATVGTILCYAFYWIFVIAVLVYMKWSEGRTTLFGLKSRAWHERHAARTGSTSNVSHDDEKRSAEAV